jgi:hypothetical protein
MTSNATSSTETFNPWSVVNLVFEHLADAGLHPVLGETGDPAVPARALLLSLGITPSADGNQRIKDDVRNQLDELRAVVMDQHGQQ